MKKRQRIGIVALLLLGALTACDNSGMGTGSTGTGGDPSGDTNQFATTGPGDTGGEIKP
jgi:hypothetical protein